MTIVTKATSMKAMTMKAMITTMKAITTTATILKPKPIIRKPKRTPTVEVMRLSFRQPKLKQPA